MEDMEDLEKEIEELKNKINELEGKVEKETKDIANEWKPKYNELYYYVDLDFVQASRSYWNDDAIDEARYVHRVIFKTHKQAEEYWEYLKEKEKHMNTFTEEEWENNNIDKWYYVYCYENKTIVPAYKTCYKTNTSYFRTREEVKNFIQKYEWQIKHEFGVE